MLAFRQFGVGCHVVNIAVKLVRDSTSTDLLG